jgi:hypothetical protein
VFFAKKAVDDQKKKKSAENIEEGEQRIIAN